MIQQRLTKELDHVGRRYRTTRRWITLGIVWLVLATIAYAVSTTGILSAWDPTAVVAVFVSIAAIATIVSSMLVSGVARDHNWVAQRIEARYPELDARLLAAVQQKEESEDGRFGYLQETVITQTITHCYRNPWGYAVPNRNIWMSRLTGLCALALLCYSVTLLSESNATDLAKSKTAAPDSSKPVALTEVSVEPGDTEIERGRSLIVIAKFEGPLPADVFLIMKDKKGQQSQMKMSRSFVEDPIFAGRIRNVRADFSYRVEYGETASELFDVATFEYPALIRFDAQLSFPEYTGVDAKLVEDTRRVTVVEGTTLKAICRLNKSVASARLVDSDGEEIALSEEDEAVYTTSMELTRSARYRLHLIDSEGRANREPPELIFNVTPNKPPELVLAQPAKDTQVSPIEELDLKATMRDDFGLKSYGVSYSIATQPAKEVVLGESGKAKVENQAEFLLEFESMQAKPNDLLTYFFWAEDYDAAGQPRRTFSDMYFAEVRHFEEIFRQGEQPQGSQQQQQQQQQQQSNQNAQEAEELAELQKQIINGTWTVIRRETKPDVSDDFADDVQLLSESQQAAVEKVVELAEQITQQDSQQFVTQTLQYMDQAIEHLDKAIESNSPQLLQQALAAEQAAYQSLLALRATEHEVIQRQQQPGQRSQRQQNNRSQQQLNQLELRNDRNRYEQQSTAQEAQEDDQEREVRQTLSRLSELARRQSDLNKQLQELQTALEAAEDELEREEIERQLKRLREEQQQILRDTDELQERMNANDEQQTMQEASEQLEETRENVRQAADALQRNDVSQAVAEGSRAEEQFEELEEEFRKAAAGQFTETMRDMRNEAQDLERQQLEVAEGIERLNGEERKLLRDSGDRERLNEDLAEQKQRLDDLMERMQEVVTESEESEPLLSKRLYDTFRQTRQGRVDQDLQDAADMLDQGFVEESSEFEERAREGISELVRGVERAAESVLGDDGEALKRAEQTLRNLADELENEIAENDPNRQGQQQQDQPQQGQPQQGQPQQGQPQQGQPQQGQPQQGQPQQGQPQQGQPQQGQPQQGQPQQGQPQQGQPQQGQPQQGQPQQGQPQQGQPQQGQPQQGQPQQGQPQQGQPQQGQPQQGQPRQGQPQQGQPQQGQPRQGQPQQGQPQQGQPQQGQPQQGQPQQGQPQQGQPQQGQPQQGQPQQGQPQQGGQQGGQNRQSDATRLLDSLGAAFGPSESQGGNPRPLTGDNFLEWSDRLRDVEQMIDDAELRAEAARIRDRARGVRVEFKRHSKKPNWELVDTMIAQPLAELRNRVQEALINRQSKKALVPIDRDPVPPRFTSDVEKYYERLGSGE